MKVAVKKRVLFNLLKSRLNENRMPGGDHGGRVIHPFNVQSPNSDPFGFYEDDENTPIKVSDHMSVQLSVPKMPVEDENFVPGTIQELCNSASLICKEVPVAQIEYFYRQLHILLDKALDREDDMQFGELNESYSITQNTTIKDFNIVVESSTVKRTKNLLKENLPAELQPEDLPGFEKAKDKDEYMRGYNMAADFETAGKSEEELESHDEYVRAQSADFLAGYDAGSEVAAGISDVGDDRPYFPSQPGGKMPSLTGRPHFRNYQQFLSRDGLRGLENLTYEKSTPYEKALMDSSAELATIFSKINQEANAVMMDPKTAKEFGALMTPISQEFGLGSSNILTPLNVKRMFAYVNRMKQGPKKEAKIQELLMKIYVIVSEATDKLLKRSPRYSNLMKRLANEAGIPFNEFLISVKQNLSADMANYGVSSRFVDDEELVNSKVDAMFARFIKTLKLPGTDNKFKNRKHFHANVDLDSQEQILDGFKAVVIAKFQDANNPGLFVIKDAGEAVSLDEEELIGVVESLIEAQFSMAREQQDIGPEAIDSEIDISDEATDEVEEIEAEDYMSALELFAARHAQGKQVEWQDLAPYFGYSGTAGMRQYFLKDVLPKLEMMAFTDDTGAPSNVGSLMDFNAQVLTDQMLVVINSSLIPKYEKLVADNKIKQQKVNAKNKVQEVGTVEILGALKEQIVPVLETLQRLFNQGEKYTKIAADRQHRAHELLNLVGGYVFREVNMAPITAVYNTMRADLSDAIADSIIARVGEDKVSRKAITEKGGIGEYFTRLKNEPDYAAAAGSKKGKIVQKLLDIGLTPEIFAEVLVDAEASWQDDILDSVQDYDGALYKDAIENAVDELTNNPKQLENAILAGIKATKQEEIYQKLERQTGV